MLKYYLDKDGKIVKSVNCPSSEYVDMVPREGSLNPVSSGGMAGELAESTKSSSVAPDYDPESTYPTIGTAVMHGGLRYVSNTAINTPEEWTAANWTEKSVEDEIGNVEALLAAL